jgi:AraC-like DNA-binding protein
MANIKNLDFFSCCPVKEFVGAGFEKYRPQRLWERNIANASLYFIAEGSLDFMLETKSFTACQNDVVFLGINDIAKIRNSSPENSSLYYIAFNYENRDFLQPGTVFKSTSHLSLFKDILDAHRSGAPFSNLKIFHLFHKLLYSLCVDSLKTKEDYLLTSRINAAAEYININYYKNIDIGKLSSLTGYSPAHLRRLFIKNFGMSPRDYILTKRIDVAKEMLLDIPEKNIDEIADLLGMGSTSYFCKLFRAKTGVSPTLYRKNSRSDT